MAKIRIPTPGLNDLMQIGTNPLVEEASNLAGYAFRAKIILDRNTRGFEKAQVAGPPDAYETSGLPIMDTSAQERERAIRTNTQNRYQDTSVQRDQYTFGPTQYADSNTSEDARLIDFITIADIDVSPYELIQLPFIPREISYQPSSKFIGIATMARNNPHYHFTGSEDSITFEIDWYTERLDRTDVINACRKIESFTKGDSYTDIPHRVKLIWGQDDKLFVDDVWLITDAPYTLTEFTKGYKDPQTNERVRIGMLPSAAMQTVTLKRLTTNNRSRQEIRGNL